MQDIKVERDTKKDLEDIFEFVRARGFDLNEEVVVTDMGDGITPYKGAVLTYDKKLVLLKKYIAVETLEEEEALKPK